MIAAGDAGRQIPPGYLLTIRLERQVFRKRLGWDAGMRTILETIAQRLPKDGHAAEVCHEMLERLEPFRAEWDKAAGLKAMSIDWEKAGEYTFGPWKYVYRIEKNGIGHWGYLYYRGKDVEGVNLNDTLQTPWGPLYWVGVREMPNGPHGWMPQADAERPDGRALPSPLDAVRYHELENRIGKLLMLIHCRQERVWANFFAEGIEDKTKARMNPLVLTAPLPVQRFKAVLADAAYAGLLAKAQHKWARFAADEPYLQEFSWLTGHADREAYEINLGTKEQVIERLSAMKAVLDSEAAEAIEKVLGQLKDSSTPSTAPVTSRPSVPAKTQVVPVN